MESIPIAQTSFPTRMHIGPGALARLPDELVRLGVRRPLLVADPGLERAGLVDRVREVLAGSFDTSAYLGVSKNPKESDVIGGVAAYRELGADVVIGLGGGASMDVAKVIAVKATHGLPLAEYDEAKGGDSRIRPDLPPVIAIPTTAGTGSEVGRAGVICLGDDGHKVIIFSPHMLPKAAICDAELTVGLPPHVTAATGIDVLAHGLEAYVCRGNHPFADTFALGALARAGRYLVRAVRDGHDLRARHEMMIAATMGGMSFQKGLGGAHALAHPLGAVADVHHGLANAIVLPHVVRFNLEHASARYAVCAEALGSAGGGSETIRARACLDRVVRILEDIGLPRRLSEVGVTADMIDRMVSQALADACSAQNPRPMDAASVRALYEAAL